MSRWAWVVVSTLGLVGAVSSRAGAPDPGPEARPDPLPVVAEAQFVEVQPQLAAVTPRAGWRRWSHSLTVPGAFFLKPHFVNFQLGAGDTLTVLTATGKVVEVLQGQGPKDRGTFWGLSVFGDRLDLVLETRLAPEALPFTLDRVLVGRAPLVGAEPPSSRSVCLPPDFEDALCHQADAGKWANIRASVGVMVTGGTPGTALFCSGVNLSPVGHILTNQHCIGSQLECDNAEFVFGYRRSGCNDGSPTTTDWLSVRCDAFLESSPLLDCEPGPTSLDFSLNRILDTGSLPELPFVQLDTTPIEDAETLYIVQHPSGRPQEVTHGFGPDVVAEPTVLRYYGTLDTEPGSSGAPVFRDSNDKMVALHHCGGCDTGFGNRATPITDLYATLSPYLCSASLTLLNAGARDLTEVEGNGNGYLEPGETWSFRPSVRNFSCSTAVAGMTGRVEASGLTAGIRWISSAVIFPAVNPGGTTIALAPVSFVVGPLAACGTAMRFDLTNLVITGGSATSDVAGVFATNLGELVRTTLFTSDFDSAFPGPWTVEHFGSGTGDAATWTTANPGSRDVPLDAPFAIVDSDRLGIGLTMDEGLLTPQLDVTAFSGLRLRYRHDFNWYELGLQEIADVDVRSVVTGGVWHNLRRYQGVDARGQEEIDLTPWGGGRPDVQVRFRYHNARFEWWWGVDEVRIEADNGWVCTPFQPTWLVFADGFTSGSASRWSVVVGGT